MSEASKPIDPQAILRGLNSTIDYCDETMRLIEVAFAKLQEIEAAGGEPVFVFVEPPIAKEREVMSQEGQQPTSTDQPGTDDDASMVRLIKQLFRELVADYDLDTEQMRTVKIRNFWDWYHGNDKFATPRDVTVDSEINNERKTKLQLPDHILEAFHKQAMGDEFRCCILLFPMWPMLILQGQPPLKHKIKYVRLLLHIGWEDEKIANLMGQSLEDPTDPFTNGTCATLYRGHSIKMIDKMAQIGMDRLHDEVAQFPPEVIARKQADRFRAGGGDERAVFPAGGAPEGKIILPPGS